MSDQFSKGEQPEVFLNDEQIETERKANQPADKLFIGLAVFCVIVGLSLTVAFFAKKAISTHSTDSQRRITQIQTSDGRTATFRYGQQSPIPKSQGEATTTYDAAGNKLAEPSQTPATK